MHKRASFLLILMIFILPGILYSQTAMVHPNPDESLARRWDWAVRMAGGGVFEKGGWIGYGITRLMGSNSHIGNFNSYPGVEQITLESVILGRKPDADAAISDEQRIENAVQLALREFEDEEVISSKVPKKVAILFRFQSPRIRKDEVQAIKVSNLNLQVDLDDLPLIWLGQAENAQSLNFLEDLYEAAPSSRECKRLVMAIGVHDDKLQRLAILEKILKEDENYKVRKPAAFWLGQTDEPKALDILKRTIHSDPSDKVREHAVFAISRMELDGVTDELIEIARKGKDRKVREKAIFWLGQRASKRAEAAIQDIVYSGESTEIQKKAVFALTQLPDNRGLDRIIKIAKDHPNIKVRKHAIFWLGQNKDPQALEALIDIINNDQ